MPAIPTRDLRVIANGIRENYFERRTADRLLVVIERALRPSSARRKTEKRRRDHRAELDEIKRAIRHRSGGTCEVVFLSSYRCVNLASEPHHVFGRGRGREPQSERNCIDICRRCHDSAQTNEPSADYWWRLFVEHFERHGYHAEAARARERLAFVRAREALTRTQERARGLAPPRAAESVPPSQPPADLSTTDTRKTE